MIDKSPEHKIKGAVVWGRGSEMGLVYAIDCICSFHINALGMCPFIQMILACECTGKRVYVYFYVSGWVGANSGAGSAWMSLIVPVRPSDNAGGQIGMKPEQGDSDK